MKNKHLISPMDFSKEELNEIFELAEKFISNPKEFSHICDGKILATLFMNLVLEHVLALKQL